MKDRCVKFIKNIWLNHHFKLIMIALIATLPILIFKDIPISHDILFHLSRISGISYELSLGNISSFIYHNFLNNLGYASPLFYPDFFLYPFAFLYKVFNLTIIFKILIFSVNLATVYVIDFVLKRITTNKNIINIGTLLYVFSSYRMVDIYHRGCIGEGLSFIFLPLIILGLFSIVNGDKKKFYYLVIGMTGLIYSHVISSFIVVLFIFFYLLLNIKKIFVEKRYLYFLWSVLLTFLLTCSFILPLLEQLYDRTFYIHHLTASSSFNNIYVPLHNLFLEFPIPNNEWYPLGIGIVYLYFIWLGYKYRQKLKYNDFVWLFLGIFFLLASTSLIPRIIYNKFLYIIQFQWRFYMLATISLFFFGINLMKNISKKHFLITKKIIIASIVMVVANCVVINVIYDKTNVLNREYLGHYEYLPEGILVEDIWNDKYVLSSNNDLDFKYYFDGDKGILNYSENNYSNTIVTVPLLYYKGYKTNKDCQIINNNGLVGIKLNKVSDEIVIYYAGTKIIYFSRIVTFITILSIIIYYIRKKGLYDEVKPSI